MNRSIDVVKMELERVEELEVRSPGDQVLRGQHNVLVALLWNDAE